MFSDVLSLSRSCLNKVGLTALLFFSSTPWNFWENALFSLMWDRVVAVHDQGK